MLMDYDDYGSKATDSNVEIHLSKVTLKIQYLNNSVIENISSLF